MQLKIEVLKLKEEIATAWSVAIDAKTASDSQLASLRASFWASGLFLLLVTGIAVVVLLASGKVRPELPLDLGKCFSLAGAFFAGWGAWMGLLTGGVGNSWKGLTPYEVARSGFFKLFFLVGVFLAALGSLWWQ